MNLFVQVFNYVVEFFFFWQLVVLQDWVIYVDVVCVFVMVGSLVFLGIMFYLDVIQYFLGVFFCEGFGILLILFVVNFFFGFYYNFFIGYKFSDQIKWVGYIVLVGLIIILVVNIFFILSFIIYVFVWVSFSCFFSMSVVGYWFMCKLWLVDYCFDKMVYYLFIVLIVWGLFLVVGQYLVLSMVVNFFVNMVIFVVVLGVWYYIECDWLFIMFGLCWKE